MNRILNSRLFSVFLLFLIFWLGSSLVNLNGQRKLTSRDIRANEEKISEARKNTDSLNQFLKNMENPSFLEREARIKFNYKNPDEQVAFIYRDTDKKPVSQSFENLLRSMPNYKKWWYWLVGY